MAIAPQRSKGVRWLYIIIALVVVIGLAYWFTNYNAGTTTDGAAPGAAPAAAPAATTTN